MKDQRFFDRKTIAENPEIIEEYNDILGENLLTFGIFLRSKEYFKNWYNDAFDQGIISKYQRRRLMDINEGLNPKLVKEKAQKEYERTITIND